MKIEIYHYQKACHILVFLAAAAIKLYYIMELSTKKQAFITEIGFEPPVTVHSIPSFVTEEAVREHLIDSLIAWGSQGGDFAPFDSPGLSECILFAL